jgi:hypothetical protein
MAKGKIGTVIQADGKIYRKEFSKDNMLRDLYAAIGGGCDMVEAPDIKAGGRRVTMWLDEDGHANRQPYNDIATMLWWATWGMGNGPILGNVVIFGESIVKELTRLGYEVEA